MSGEIAIERGTPADYDRLSRFHYRAGRPATCVRVLVAVERRGGRPVGVLTVSMPAVNGPWRERVWPGLYAPLEATARARRAALAALNGEVRAISRVVVEPRWRGLGVGGDLVRAYLRSPLTQRTEALAAMGRFCPLFERAGMTPAAFPLSRRVVRMRRTLRRLGVAPWRLADPAALLGTLEPAAAAALVNAARVFAGAHRDTRARADAPAMELVTLVARRVACRPVAYVHEARGTSRGGEHVA